MASLVQSIARLAHSTFNKCHSDEPFNESLTKLTKLISQLTHTDINLNKELMASRSSTLLRTLSTCTGLRSLRSPVSHVSICESSTFSLSVFALRHDMSRIPLHDHPDMYGFIKVVFGSVTVKHYTPLPKEGKYVLPNDVSRKVSPYERHFLVPAVHSGNITIDSDSEHVCTLTPTEHNIHEVTAVNGPAAIVDLLAPPYHARTRECHYYSVIDTVYDKQLSTNITWLLESIETPDDYWCDSIQYCGPQIVI